MSKMEGFLMKKGWFNNWKMRYVTCSDKVLSIFKAKGEEKTGNTFNVIDCSIKKIDAKRWNRKYVFRLKVAGKRFYLAAEDETTLNKWINVIRGRVERESLLGANAVRAAQCDKRRSTMASLSRLDCQQLISFQADTLVETYKNAIISSTDPEAQFKFAETCGEFLAIAHSQSQGIFQANEIHAIDGMNVRFVNKKERRDVLKQMKVISYLYSMHTENVFFPLQCLIDYTGRTLFIEVKVDGTDKISPENAQRIQDMGLDPKTTKALQDKNGKLWILSSDVEPPTANEDDIKKFVRSLDNMLMFVFDSQSLSEQMRSHNIPVSKLPELSDLTTIPAIRTLIQTEMIARTCKHIISDRLAEVEKIQWTREIIKYFDFILGNNEESNKFWEETLTPRIKDKFGVEITKQLPMLHMPQLFFSLQFHTGADFKDINEYDFSQEHPVLLEHMSSINAVPHHFLVEICTSLRDIDEDPYSQLSCGFYNNAMLALNNKVSLFQSIYGDENVFVASGLSQLSQAYLGLGYADKADLCARGAIGAGRHFHAALIPAYITLISTCQEEEIDKYMNEALQIVNFQLSDIHWFEADVLMAAASAKQNTNNLQEAAKLAQDAVEIVYPLLGPGHPKTAKCGLLQGKIHRMLGQFAAAQPLIQQALYAMINAFGEHSVQCAECKFELADVLLDSGQSEDAEREALEALKIRQDNYEADNSLVIDCIQQLAVIYDTMNIPEKAYTYYKILINFLKKLEDESIFEEMVKVMRNILCLFFRTAGTTNIQTVNLLRRKKVGVDEMKAAFQHLIDNDPIDITKTLFDNYQNTGEPNDFDTLAAIYHIGMDDMSTLTWLEEH